MGFTEKSTPFLSFKKTKCVFFIDFKKHFFKKLHYTQKYKIKQKIFMSLLLTTTLSSEPFSKSPRAFIIRKTQKKY